MSLIPSVAELPQVVWLQGDEPYFQEFSLSAEEVMERLQIKRSRLTQISGKELRVGKVRFQHYLRPRYREEDVQGYLDSVRAFATRQKSVQMLQEVQDSLKEHTEGSFASVVQGVETQLAALRQELLDRQAGVVAQGQREGRRHQRQLLHRATLLYQGLHQENLQMQGQFQWLKKALSSLLELNQSLLTFVQNLSADTHGVRVGAEYLKEQVGVLTAQVELLAQQRAEEEQEEQPQYAPGLPPAPRVEGVPLRVKPEPLSCSGAKMRNYKPVGKFLRKTPS